MNTKVIAAIFVILVVIAGIFFFGGVSNTSTHVMPDGTVMDGTTHETMMEQSAPAPSGTHTMPNGATMDNTNMHVMPDGTMMHN